MTTKSPVAEVINGPWGDRYTTIELQGDELDTRAVAVMRMIEYGSVPVEEAKRNTLLIAAAPEMRTALEQILEIIRGPFSGLPQIRAIAEEALRVAAEGHPEDEAKIRELSAKLHAPSVVK